jgi:hypothetical protein
MGDAKEWRDQRTSGRDATSMSEAGSGPPSSPVNIDAPHHLRSQTATNPLLDPRIAHQGAAVGLQHRGISLVLTCGAAGVGSIWQKP